MIIAQTPVFRSKASLLLLLSLAIVGCRSRPDALEPAVHADRILVEKSRHTLTLLSHGAALKTYKISIGRGSGNAKRREGDHETPEGVYTIDSRNAHSHFHRALHISYPNDVDRQRAETAGVSPGGQIMIHGIQNGLGWLGSLHERIDWTDGCIAVTDPEIEEIWNLVPNETSIEIRH